MARTTISDDLKFIPNKYELGMLAGQRVRDLNGGEVPVVSVEPGTKPAVTALREIASGKLDIGVLRGEFIQSYKKIPVVDEAEDTLESNAAAPELKELDAELSGELQTPDGVSAADARAELSDEAAEDSEIEAEDDEAGEELSDAAESAEEDAA